MTEPQILSQTLDAYADRAGEARGDMLDVVERRYRVRRRRQTIGSITAALMVIALVAAGVTLNPFGGTAKPVTPTTYIQDGPWRLPKPGAPVPLATKIWSSAFTTVPDRTPDGGEGMVWSTIDASHLLVSDTEEVVIPAFYSYDTVHHTFATIVSDVNAAPGALYHAAASPHWVVWALQRSSGRSVVSDIYRAPLSGGIRQHVATVNSLAGNVSSWFVTDDAVYWSGDAPGVIRQPLAGGAASVAPGLAGFYMDGDSSWAVSFTARSLAEARTGGGFPTTSLAVTRQLRNVVTGEHVDVISRATDSYLGCSLRFCIGADNNGEFVQRLDGSARTAVPMLQGLISDSPGLPGAGPNGLLEAVRVPGPDRSTLPVGQYFWDPISGVFVHYEVDVNGGATTSAAALNDVMSWPIPGLNGSTVLELGRIQ